MTTATMLPFNVMRFSPTDMELTTTMSRMPDLCSIQEMQRPTANFLASQRMSSLDRNGTGQQALTGQISTIYTMKTNTMTMIYPILTISVLGLQQTSKHCFKILATMIQEHAILHFPMTQTGIMQEKPLTSTNPTRKVFVICVHSR